MCWEREDAVLSGNLSPLGRRLPPPEILPPIDVSEDKVVGFGTKLERGLVAELSGLVEVLRLDRDRPAPMGGGGRGPSEPRFPLAVDWLLFRPAVLER